MLSTLFSIIFSIAAYFWYLEVKDFVENSYISKGVVVRIDKAILIHEDGEKSSGYVSVIKYKLHNDEIKYFKSDARADIRYDINEAVGRSCNFWTI